MNKMKVALATALKFPNWHLCRLCLVMLVLASSWQGSHAAYMYVKGTASPYYKIGDGSFNQMTNHFNTSDGTIWYYANVDNGSTVTFASSSDGDNASPAIPFDSSNDSYFYFGEGAGINLTSQKTSTACFYFSAGSWWADANAVFKCHMKQSDNVQTQWPGDNGTIVGGNSNTTIYAFTQPFTPSLIVFTRIDPATSNLWNQTKDISGNLLTNGAYYIVNSANNDREYDDKKDITIVSAWPNRDIFTGELYLIGQANENSWQPNVGIKMTAMNSANTHFKANSVHLKPSNNGFAFATQLANNDQDWATLNAHRLGSNGDGNRWNITENLLNQWNNNLQVDYNYEKNFVVDIEGDYDVEVNLETMQVKVSQVSEQPSTASHYNGPGYYRLQNAQTLRYANAVDNKGMEVNPQTGVNSPSLNSIDLVSGDPTALPGTIIYIDGTDEIPVFGQGLDLQTQGIGTMMLTRFLLQNMESLIAGLIGSSGSVEIDPEAAQQFASLPGVPIHIEEQTEGDYQGSYIAYIQATLGEDSQPIKANFVDVEGNQAHFGRNFDILMYGNGKNKWNVFPVNEIDNYFTVTPCQTAVNGKYYTTLSVDFGYKILSEAVTAYIVTAVENDGNPTLSQIATTNGLVARGASVVLESSSPDAIKLLPMDGGDTALLEGNLLSIAIDEEGLLSYFAEVRNDDTESFTTLEDGTKTFTKTFEQNEMLPANKAFFNAGYRTLQWIVNNGSPGKKYTIKDELQIVYAFKPNDNESHIFVKDDNNYLIKSVMPDTDDPVIDYMGTIYTPHQPVSETDQSNWLEIIAETSIFNESMPQDLKTMAMQYDVYGVQSYLPLKYALNGVYGELMDKENPTLRLLKVPEVTTKDVQAKVNTYITANFFDQQTQNNCFFVKPKPQEIAFLTWGVYNGNGAFVMPSQDNPGFNGLGLHGGYNINDLLNEGDNNFLDGYGYEFYGVIQKKTSTSRRPNRVEQLLYDSNEPISSEFEVSPLYIDNVQGIITSVANVKVERQVAGVEYVNLAGQRSAKPWQGVNIVVTRYTDGTTRSTKAIM